MGNITEATENYLETILVLSQHQKEVHAVDICTELGYSRPTVSEFLKGMREKGLVEVDANNHLWLTEAGRSVAEDVYSRHNTLVRFLNSIGVDLETAEEDACKIEHDISYQTIQCIRRFLKEQKTTKDR